MEKLRDCVIDDLWISDDSGKEDEMFIDIPKVVVANDITWGSTEDEVLEVFGKPDEIDETGVGPIIYIYIYSLMKMVIQNYILFLKMVYQV